MEEAIYRIFDLSGGAFLIVVGIFWFIQVRYVLKLPDPNSWVLGVFCVSDVMIGITRFTCWFEDMWGWSGLDHMVSIITSLTIIYSVYLTYVYKNSMVEALTVLHKSKLL